MRGAVGCGWSGGGVPRLQGREALEAEAEAGKSRIVGMIDAHTAARTPRAEGVGPPSRGGETASNRTGPGCPMQTKGLMVCMRTVPVGRLVWAPRPSTKIARGRGRHFLKRNETNTQREGWQTRPWRRANQCHHAWKHNNVHCKRHVWSTRRTATLRPKTAVNGPGMSR